MVSVARIMSLSPTILLLRNLKARLLLCGLFFACLSSSGAAQESSNGTFYSNASKVRIVFFATDKKNRPLQNLTKDDFAVVDNEEVIRDFRSLTRSTEMKLDVIVLFDASDSVLPRFQQEIADLLQLLLPWPWNPDDEVSVLSFSGTQTYPLCAGDCAGSLTADRIMAAPRGGSTPLFDALDTAASLLQSRPRPDVWPVIILFSDGDDTISIDSYSQAVEKILTSQTHVYAVDLNRFGPSRGRRTLQELADTSGGRYVETGDDATRISTAILEDLHSARVVTYALRPSNSDFHAVRILPSHDLNLQFRSMHGYYAPPSNTSTEDHP